MNVSEFQKRSGSPQPVYLLLTSQAYIRKLVYDHCVKQVPEAGRAFDWNVFDLEQDQPSDVISAARTLPWFSPRRWIYVKNAASGEKALLPYFERPSERTVLVLEVDKRPAGWPELPIVEPGERADLTGWLCRKAQNEGYEVEEGAIEALVEIVGEDLQLLVSELEKLLLYGLDSRKITIDSVRDAVSHARQYDVFALGEAIASGDARQALAILNALNESGMSTQLIISTLYANFRRLLVALELLDRGKRFPDIVRLLNLWSYKGRESAVRKYKESEVRNIIIRLHDADRTSKSTSIDMKAYLERLVIDTCRRISV